MHCKKLAETHGSILVVPKPQSKVPNQANSPTTGSDPGRDISIL
jgi:hypothetical protein